MLKDIGSIVVIRGLGSLTAFFLTIFVIKVLGTSQSGLYFLTVSIIGTVIPFCIVGMTDFVIKNTGANLSLSPNVVIASLSNVIKIVGGISIAFSCILFFFHDQTAYLINKPGLAPLIQVVSFSLPFQTLSAVLIGVLLGAGKTNKAALYLGVIVPVTLIVLVSVLLVSSVTINSLIMITSYAVAVSFTFIHLSKVVLSLLDLDLITFSKSFSRELPQYPLEGKSFFLINVTNVVFSSGLFLISGLFLELAEVTALSVCLRICVALNLFVAGANLYAAPHFSRLKNNNELEDLRIFTQKISRYLIIVCGPILFLLIAFSNGILSIFDESLSDFSWALRTLVAAQFAAVLAGPSTYLLMMSGFEKEARNMNVIAGACAVFLVLISSWRFGFDGAVISLALSLLLQFVLPIIIVRKKFGFLNFGLR